MIKGAFGNEFYESSSDLRTETDTPSGFAYVANLGQFRWVDDSTDTDDDATVIKVASVTTGRYVHVEKNSS